MMRAALVLMAACGGQSLDMGYDDARTDAFDPSQPVDAAAIHARCGVDGADVPYSTDAAARAILAGRWFVCETNGEAGMNVPQAIEFTADGSWFALVGNADGVYARDPNHAGTYKTAKVLSCCYPDTWDVTLVGEAGFFVGFRSGPRQMLWARDTTSGRAPRPTVVRFAKG
jgi:hypothetical protein